MTVLLKFSGDYILKDYTLFLLRRPKGCEDRLERSVRLESFVPSSTLIELKLKFLLFLRGAISWRHYWSHPEIFNVLRIRREHTTIGYVFSFVPTVARVGLYFPCIEVSIAIDADYRGRGLGVEAIDCLISFFSNADDKFNIIALVNANNAVSNRLFRRFSIKEVCVVKRTRILTAYYKK